MTNIEKTRQFSMDLENPESPCLTDENGNRSTRLSGTAIEGQWCIGKHRLLLLSNDAPYDELISILAVTDSLKIIDEINIGGWYNSGIVEHAGINSLTITFNVFGYAWTVVPHFEHPRYFPAKLRPKLPRGARRPMRQLLKPGYMSLQVRNI